MGRLTRRVVLAAGATAALLLAPVAAGLGQRGTVAVVALDVGQGDAILVRSPGGRWLLVDAGPRTPVSDAGLRRVLPALRRLGIRRLEALVLTHPDLDHVGGAAAVLRGVPVGAVLDPGRARGTDAFVEALEAAAERGVPWTGVGAGTIYRLDGMALEVLHPVPGTGGEEDPNDLSVVLLLRHGAFTALLTGDAPREVEDRLADGIGTLQLLKVAHHGSTTSSSRAFLEGVRPALALVSAGRGNRYGHPAPEVLARLDAVGARVLRTDLAGTLTVRAAADGSWRVAVERSPLGRAPARGARVGGGPGQAPD